VYRKKETKMFFITSPTKLGDADEIWYTVSWIKLLQNDTNVFHLNQIVSLHYLMKLEMLIGYVLPLSWYRKKLQNLSRPNCGLHLRQICYQFITACRKYCKNVQAYKTSTTDLELSTMPLINGCCNDDMIQLGPLRSQSLFQFVRSLMCILYTINLLLQ